MALWANEYFLTPNNIRMNIVTLLNEDSQKEGSIKNVVST